MQSDIRNELVANIDFGGLTQEEIDAEIERMVAEQVGFQEEERRSFEAQQAIALSKYDVAQSPFTLVGFGLVPLIALVFATTLILGEEFRYGTVRTSLLAASDRRQFLAARLITFLAMIVALFAALILLSLVLALMLRVFGAEIPPSPQPINAAASIALFASELLITFTFVAFGVALTLLTRSGALPLLILAVWVLAELFVFSLAIFQVGQPLAAVPLVFLTTNIRALLTTLAADTGAIALVDSGSLSAAISIPTWGVAAIVVAWAVLFLAIADRRFRSMDIVE